MAPPDAKRRERICEFCILTASDIYKRGYDKGFESANPAQPRLSDVERVRLLRIETRLRIESVISVTEDDVRWLISLVEKLAGITKP